MTPMIVTKETGAKTMPIGMTVAELGCRMTAGDLQDFADGAPVNKIFLANLMSACASHERCGVHLYRTAAGMTTISEWRARYEEFGRETEEHVRILAELTAALGGDPMYVSPQARADEALNTKLMEPLLLGGSMETLTQELALLDAVVLAETRCHANWELLGQLAARMPDSAAKDAMRQAVEQVERQEDEHVRWARATWRQTLIAQVMPGA
jgi:rubrerythrin